MIIRSLTVGSMGVCCYVLGCEGTHKGLIIDPGGSENSILDLCAREGLQIEYIVNTHFHPDHVCGNAIIKKATGASIIMHEEDALFMARPDTEKFFSMLGLPPSPSPDLTVKDGDRVTVGTVSLEVIHTPGHTPGGMCLYSPPYLFTGDTLFVGGIGRTDFPGGNHPQMMQAIRSRLLTLPPETVVFPGHGYGGARSTIGEEARANPFISGI